MPDPSIRSTGKATQGGGTSFDIPKPSGAATGDWVILFVLYTADSTGTSTASVSGFGSSIQRSITGSGIEHNVIETFAREIDGSEGANFAVTLTNWGYYDGYAICVQDTAGVDGTPTEAQFSAYVLDRDIGGNTTAAANELALACGALWYSGTFESTPTGWTSVDSDSNNEVWQRTYTSAGAQSITTFDSAGTFELFVSTTVVMSPADTGVTGTIAMTLDALSTSIAGTETISGTVAATLSGVTTAVAGTETIAGAVALTLDPITASVVGTETITGTIAVTLDPITTSLYDDPNVTGTIAITLADLTTSIEGTEAIAGEITLTLDELTSALEGESVFFITGEISMTLDDLVSYVQGERRGKALAEIRTPGPQFRSTRARRRYYDASRNPVTDH